MGKRVKIVKIVGSILFCVGIILIAVTFFLYQNTSSFIDESQITTGDVIDLSLKTSTSGSGSSHVGSGVYYPIVQFTTDRGEVIEFRGHTGSKPPAYRKGDVVSVRYMPEDPYNARINTFFSVWLVVIIPGSLAFLFTLIGAVLLYIVLRAILLEKRLRQSGRMISTEFQSVSQDTSVTINGRHPFRIYSQWFDPVRNEVVTFKSKCISYNPENYIHGTSIVVRVDPDNPKKYIMDTSFLPKGE